MDDEPPPANPWRGYLFCLRTLVKSEAEHGVVLQDDTIVCRNFPPAVERIAQARPDNVVVLFVGGSGVGKAMVRDAKGRYCVIPSQPRYYVPAVGILWPRSKAADVLEWAETAPRKIVPHTDADDGFLGLWKRQRKETVLVTRPSLVQHPDDMPSTISRRGRAQRGDDRGRVALHYIGGGDPLDLDWS